MAESKKLVTKNNRLHSARQLVESISEPANTAYYAFFGNHLEYANTSFIPQPNDSISDVIVDVYRNMIYGKRINEADVSLMIKRNNYIINKKYDMYDDTVGESNVSFFSSNFYVTVDSGTFHHVFKCLDNNKNANSIVQPEFSEIDIEDEFYQTSDGYVWKYMYSVDSSTVSKFSTTDFFPVVPNTQVQAAAKTGVIDVIKVENAGRGYDNHCNGTFRADDLRIGGNSLVYSINTSLTANTANDYYNDCYIYISRGTGVGQYSKISDYVVNSTVKAIILNEEFSVPPASDSGFEISPGVLITGDGTQAINAEARAIINSAGNVVQRIEMLNLGEGYTFATAIVLSNSVIPVTNNAVLRPIFPPPGGHGSDPAAELGATRVCFSVKFSNTDVDIPTSNEYRSIGILKDPVFSEALVDFNTSTGNFIAGERLFKINGTLITDEATVSTASAIVTADAEFNNQLSPGEFIYLYDGSNYELATVNSISNSSYMTLSKNSFISCTAVKIYKTQIGSRISSINLSPSILTGNLSINATSQFAFGKGTDFSTDLIANISQIFVYSNSSGSGEIKKVLEITTTQPSFNANTDVSNANEFISVSSNPFVNNDLILYYTATGNTALTGLSNNSYYFIVSANSTGVKLSDTLGGSARDITASSVSESGHFLKMQKIKVNSNFSYANSDAKMQHINYTVSSSVEPGIQSSTATVASVATGTIEIKNISGIFSIGDKIIGESSGATGIITNITRSGVSKNFNTFVQMDRFIGTPISGTFEPDETVFQSISTNIADAYANSRFHSFSGSGSSTNYFVTNKIGVFNTATNLLGANSGSSALITNKYSPELVFGSGEVIYLERIEPITRSSTTSETIKFIFEF